MREEKVIKEEVWYISEIDEEIKSKNERDKSIIEWADTNPIIYKIVTEKKSKAWGWTSSDYIWGAQKNNSPDAILEKIRTFKCGLDKNGINDFWGWRANFTLKHYNDKEFKGGLFQQWDKKYLRNCVYLDFTPELLDEVIEHFVGWIGKNYDTQKITVDDREIAKEKWENFLI